MDDAGVDGNKLSALGILGKTAIIDSGTSLIFLPEPEASAIHNLIPGSKKKGTENFVVPCDTDKAVWLSLGGQNYNISAADWVGDETDGGCGSKIIGRTTLSETQWLLEVVFMKNVYTAFNFNHSKVGFRVKATQGAMTSVASTSENYTPTPTVATGKICPYYNLTSLTYAILHTALLAYLSPLP